MLIDSLALHNFRLFKDLEINFDSRMSVIVGVNGSGKSSVLDAMGILLSCYTGGFDGHGATKIAQSDIRHDTHVNGGMFENVPQLPVRIGASGTIGRESVSWKSEKAKNSPQSGSPSAYREITQLASDFQNHLRDGNAAMRLPLVAYYGTGRLWKQSPSQKKANGQLEATFGRLSAYDGCLDAHLTDTTLSTWFERMTYKSLQQGSDIPTFAAVRCAVETALKALTGFEKLTVQSNLDTHELDVMYEEDGVPMRVRSSQLSDGYRVILNLFADIAYRAAVLNPQLGDAVLSETEGIVLVDEIDLHLHPQWQQRVLADLADTFPKMQFVVTTHAPAVISSVRDGSLIVVCGNEAYSSGSGFYGKDVNSILREIMGVPERPRPVVAEFDKFYTLMDEGDFSAAETKLRELEELLGPTDVELATCRMQLDLERMPLL